VSEELIFMLPHTTFLGIQCRKDTLLVNTALIISMMVCTFAIVNKMSVNNALVRRDLTDALSQAIEKRAQSDKNLVDHVNILVNRQDAQDLKVKEILDQAQLNQTRMQVIEETLLKAKKSKAE
jgi:hypothetical protein